jgi:nicotinamidase/pyrazinamidase
MKRLLVVTDYQNDFVVGSLGFKEALSFYEPIQELISDFTKAGDDVVFTRDVHEANYLHTEEGRNLPVPHCLRGSEGALFYGKLEEISKNYPVFEKRTFPSDALLDFIKKGSYREVVLCGVDLSICVLSNAVIAKAAAPDAHIVVDLSASGTGDPAAAETAIAELHRLEIETTNGITRKGIIY